MNQLYLGYFMTDKNTPEVIGKETQQNENNLEAFLYFPSAVYVMEKLEFLTDAKEACKKAVAKQKKKTKLDEIYPVYMTENLYQYKGMDKLSGFIGQIAWNILSEQGYAMDSLDTVFTEFWCQEHYKHSSMEQHTHGFGSQIVGFYFIDTPKDCSRIVFHDPRSAKVQINLPETDIKNATAASNMINFVPKPGMLMFTNAWLAHSFTRHASNSPIRFIHFNLTVQQAAAVQACLTPAEII
jgi:uncharacterized protein (TIGR02466 family)